MTAAPLAPQFPLLPGLYHMVVLDPRKVLIANAGRSVILSGEGFAEHVAPLLACLDGNTRLDDLESRFGALARDVVASLAERGLVTEAGADGGSGAVVTKLSATAFPDAGSLRDVAARISRSTVLVAGCGPVAGTAAVLLAKAGMGRLLLADAGTLTQQDTAVSPFATAAHEGRLNVDLIADACRGAGAVAEPVAGPIGKEVLTDVELAVIEHGYGASAEEADACLRLRVPYLLVAQDALEGAVGPFVMPGGRPCHRCAISRRLSQKEHLEEHLAYRQHRAEAAPRLDAFLAAHVAMLAGIAAAEALRVVAGSKPATQSGVLLCDLASGSFDREELLPIPGCSACDPETNFFEGQLDG